MVNHFFNSQFFVQNRDSDRDKTETLREKYVSVSLSHALIRETARQWAIIVIQKGFEGVSGGKIKEAESRHLKIETVTETKSRHSCFGEEKNSLNYTEKLLQLAKQSFKNQQVQDKVSLPIPEGFDLPDPTKILRAAYDVWQPVRDAMPEWISYMSVRQNHQNGDKSLEKAHRDAEEAYYGSCQQCPQFQYYKQVYQRLFPPKKKQEIDWWAEPSQGASL